jgi:hypothetical protein
MENPNAIYKSIGYLDNALNKQISVTLSNELLFPYAITYIDDNVEDTNIKERYSYTMTTYKATTTVTSAYTITYTREWTSTPINTTVDIQPDNASHLYVMMQTIRQTGVSWRRKWYDVDSNTRAQAVYREITTAHTITSQGPVITKYEVDGYRTWQDHRDENTSTRTLAVISSSAEKGKVIDAINAYNSNVSYFIGATIINSYSTGGTIIADDDYIYHIFTSNGTFSPNFSGPIEALLVGGGGSGAKSPRFNGAGGGGGGGGVIRIQERNVSPGDYDIVIGNGGRGSLNESGSNTTAFGATAAGGGRGRPDVSNGIAGGCGGGVSSANSSLSGGSGKSGNLTGDSDNIATSHGGNGGNYIHLAGITIDPICGSGGGGAGGNAPNITTGETGSGAGGIGFASNILGTTYYWGGGGGGAASTSGNGRFIGGYGGKGGGGGGVGAPGRINEGAGGAGGTNSYISNGGKGGSDYYGNGGNGAPNTGGGGGGCQNGGTPGNGGSGIVIIRYQSTLAQRRANWKWYNNTTTWNTSITEWYDGRPQVGTRAAIFSNGKLYDYSATDSKLAIFINTNYRETTETDVPADDKLYSDNTFRTWEEHRTNAITLSNRNSNITYKLVSIHSSSANTTIANFAEQAGFDNIFIGGKRISGSNADGRSRNDWAWDDGSDWDHEEFFRGFPRTTYNATFTGGDTPVGSSTTTNIPEKANTNTPAATFHTSIDISQTNVKLPLLVSSSNGSIIATATAIKVLDLPYLSDTSSNTRNVDGFTDIADGENTRTTRYFNNYASTGNTNPVNVTDYQIQERTLKYEYDTFSYYNSYNANSGLTTGSFKISDNSSNYSYYRTPFALSTTISTAHVCIAITNDGMFVALGNANNVTVYMKVSNGWITLVPSIAVNFSTYTNSNMIPVQLPADFRKNIQNLAINYIAPTLFIAYGDSKTSIKVYRYTIAGQSWTSNGQPHTHNPTTATAQLSNPTNFGYFVVLSYSPSILGFTVDDKFHTYNCSGASDNSIRGSSQTLTQPSTHNVDRNIIAFKISSDADKIIVSNTSYVFIYRWNITRGDWDVAKYIDYTSANITFDYGTTKNIRAWPRSLDISNISSNECVFAVGFPDKHIYSPTSTSTSSKPSTPSNARGYVEYWKLSNTTLTKLATLFPRMRDITTNTPGDIDEYFFSAGGIKITNSNTILVAPNYKFHFNSTNKSYYMSGITASHQGHENESIGSLAAIENEVENELIRFSARDFQGASYYIGGRRITPSNWYWWTRESPSPFIWNFEAWDNNQPNVNDRAAVEVNTLTRRWNSVTNTDQKKAMYMTIMPSYSLNTFSIFNNNFFFHSSGFYSSYSTTTQSDTTTIIASWRISAGSESIRFLANGDVQQSTNSRTTMSDIRLKENIVDTRPKLQDLLKIRVVNYNLKGNKGNKLIGVVAQELEDIFPLLVGKQELSQEDIKLGKTETYKYVKYSCFDVMLIKAIQEQQAIITNLTSQLDLIDNKCKILKTIAQDVVILNQDRDFLICENELLKISINKILELMKKGTK